MTTLTTTQRDTLRDDLTEAQDLLNQAIRHIENYVNQTGDSNAEAYLLDHLRIFAGRDHGYLSRDLNLDDLLERLDDRDDEEDDTDDDDTAEPLLHSADGRDLHWSSRLHRYVTIPNDEE